MAGVFKVRGDRFSCCCPGVVEYGVFGNGGANVRVDVVKGDEVYVPSEGGFEVVFESNKIMEIAAVFAEVVEDVDVGVRGAFFAGYGSEDADCVYAEPGPEDGEGLLRFCQYVVFDAGVGGHEFFLH